jgi:hypothetical protein
MIEDFCNAANRTSKDLGVDRWLEQIILALNENY